MTDNIINKHMKTTVHVHSSMMTNILLTVLSNVVHQEAAGSSRLEHLGAQTAFIDTWQRPLMRAFVLAFYLIENAD